MLLLKIKIINTFTGEGEATINGQVYLADAGGVAEQAKADLLTAYHDAAGREPVIRIETELGGQTLAPGVYDSASGTFELTDTLTLDAGGDLNPVYIFLTASTLITAEDSNISLINGANVCNIYWKVGSSATLGENSRFVGSILAHTSISAKNAATVNGQLLAKNGAVTLINNTITVGDCIPPADPPAISSLTVTKVVSGDTGDMTLPSFEITVTWPEGFSATRTFVDGESFTWENLVPGVYTVTENRDGLSSEWTVSGEGTVQVTADQTALTTITNGYEKEIVMDMDHEEKMPKTGGNAPLTTYWGLILFGTGLLMRRKRK